MTIFLVLHISFTEKIRRKKIGIFRIGIGSRSTIPGSGFEDQDPYQNEVDPKH